MDHLDAVLESTAVVRDWDSGLAELEENQREVRTDLMKPLPISPHAARGVQNGG
jgi:hypothetical protein